MYFLYLDLKENDDKAGLEVVAGGGGDVLLLLSMIECLSQEVLACVVSM